VTGSGETPATESAPQATIAAAPPAAPQTGGADQASMQVIVKNTGTLSINNSEIISGDSGTNAYGETDVLKDKVQERMTVAKNAGAPEESGEAADDQAAGQQVTEVPEILIETSDGKVKEILVSLPYNLYIKDNADTAYVLATDDYDRFLELLKESGISVVEISEEEIPPDAPEIAVLIKNP
jgi:hypothetical protein